MTTRLVSDAQQATYRATLAEDLRALDHLAGKALRERWVDVFGQPASRHLSASLLRQSLAHRLQTRALGGVSPAIRQRLHQLSVGEPSRPRHTTALAPGARLVREWRGIPHVVEVVANGAVWEGRRYPSLSAVARAITGPRWSDPRFFGLHDAKTPHHPRID